MRSTTRTPPRGKSLPRFLAAGLLGLGIDLAVAAALLSWTGVSVPAAGGISHVVAAAAMYVVHERWTFGRRGHALSLRRFAGSVSVSFATLAVRMACLWATSEALGLGRDLAQAQLLAAAGVSTAFGYAVMRRVFSVGRDALTDTGPKGKFAA